MRTKRNIAIYFGTLLVLIGMFLPAAAAEEVDLGLSVSPENLVIGTFSKWVSVCFHAENFDSRYVATDIMYETITLEIKDKKGNIESIVINEYDRFEYTDEDNDTYDELVLIYRASDLLDKEVLTFDGSDLKFTAKGELEDGNNFTANCQAKTTLIKIPPDKGPGEHRPTDPGSGEDGESDDQKGKKGSGGGSEGGSEGGGSGSGGPGGKGN
ncbi:TPA: hypothetical protein HA351_06840 [Methanosarcinaceae archaeon]|nr:hypothetical protein [Methanosarcinaceae archaeon]